MFKILKEFINKLMIMTTSYSLNVFESPLSKEEEEYYLNKHLNGDKIARNKLIEHNLRLVAHIVKKYETKNSSVSSDDLISIGTIGLIKGIDSYSINKGVKLTTYAAKCAENATFTSKNFLIELTHYLNELELNYNFLTR